MRCLCRLTFALRWCLDELGKRCVGLSGDALRDMRESIFREKILAEYKTANHLSFKHIYTFYGVYSSSSTCATTPFLQCIIVTF